MLATPPGANPADARSRKPMVASPTSSYRDEDGDGFGDDAESALGCDLLPGYVAQAGDCDDTDPTVHAGAIDACDAAQKDEDCDGTPNNPPGGCPCFDEDRLECYPDADGDGAFSGTPEMVCPTAGGNCPVSPIAYDRVQPNPADQDCDDERADLHPGALELCGDMIDNDCNGEVDDRPLADHACRLPRRPGLVVQRRYVPGSAR